ncbi:hypothetical protein [Rhabdonatronobacter sediminivivens]|nr:hypothetical protein [Rhabdonatronobacter sediminivivens]
MKFDLGRLRNSYPDQKSGPQESRRQVMTTVKTDKVPTEQFDSDS